MFRPTLEDALLTKECKSMGGAKPIDVVQLFKVLLIKRYYDLSDFQTEYQIKDRVSFRQFLGIQTVDDVPDEKTIWACQNKLTKTGVFDRLFDDFRDFLDGKGLSFNEGKIIDATFVEAPRQRNTREENKQIKEGHGADLWTPQPGDDEPTKKHKRNKKRHKDTDARWTKKGGKNYYGYKDHVKVDKKTKLIETYDVTPANVHDSNVIAPLLREKDKGQKLYLDSSYEGKEEIIERYGMQPVICEKGCRYRSLTEEQRKQNHTKSKTRCRVEHVFGFMDGAMNGAVVRTIELMRAKANRALTNLVYNIFRFVQISKYALELIAVRG